MYLEGSGAYDVLAEAFLPDGAPPTFGTSSRSAGRQLIVQPRYSSASSTSSTNREAGSGEVKRYGPGRSGSIRIVSTGKTSHSTTMRARAFVAPEDHDPLAVLLGPDDDVLPLRRATRRGALSAGSADIVGRLSDDLAILEALEPPDDHAGAAHDEDGRLGECAAEGGHRLRVARLRDVQRDELRVRHRGAGACLGDRGAVAVRVAVEGDDDGGVAGECVGDRAGEPGESASGPTGSWRASWPACSE